MKKVCLIFLILLMANVFAVHAVANQPVKRTLDDFEPATPARDSAPVDLATVEYHNLINQAVPIERAARGLLSKNGFVVDGNYQWNRFVDAYAWIYWKDLPVMITTDSILHTVHKSYNDITAGLESGFLISELNSMLELAISNVERNASSNRTEKLDQSYADVLAYLRIGKALNDAEFAKSLNRSELVLYEQASSAVGDKRVELLGDSRAIDFTLLKPRGHYTQSVELTGYFKSMGWLGQIDFRFISFKPKTSDPVLNLSAVASVAILHDAFTKIPDFSLRRTSFSVEKPVIRKPDSSWLPMDNWQAINSVLEFMVGKSDNITWAGFERFMSDAGFTTPDDVISADRNQLLALLLDNEYSKQRITGNIVERHIDNKSEEPIRRPVSFMLFGQRFVIDSYVMGNLVYDRIPAERALASPLDAMFALGNNHALSHLQSELDTYNYQDALAKQRALVDELETEFWQAPVYNQWLSLIRTLNTSTTNENFPAAMQTVAWADRTLHTQLASWAQLRRDNILYVKQPYATAMVTCYFPDSFVEPYPAFFAALADFASSGHRLIEFIDLSNSPDLNLSLTTYFARLKYVATTLQAIAEKELNKQPYSESDNDFIQNMVIHKLQENEVRGCGAPRFIENWDGWYRDLFISSDPEHFDESPALIADVMTNPTKDPTSSLYPPRRLHAATGPVIPIFFVAEREGKPTLFVGPSFTYFEHISAGSALVSPSRVTDEDWQKLFRADTQPLAPDWTRSFRISRQQHTLLELPTEPDSKKHKTH